jgi:hypothetical protein
MRSLFLVGAMAVAFLAIDAAGFDGYYRRAVWDELWYQGQMAQYAVDHHFTSYTDESLPHR